MKNFTDIICLQFSKISCLFFKLIHIFLKFRLCQRNSSWGPLSQNYFHCVSSHVVFSPEIHIHLPIDRYSWISWCSFFHLLISEGFLLMFLQNFLSNSIARHFFLFKKKFFFLAFFSNRRNVRNFSRYSAPSVIIFSQIFLHDEKTSIYLLL